MTKKQRLVVIGNGMAGARLVEDVLARGGGERFEIAIFGDERHGNYNRILLSGVLSGTHRAKDIFLNPIDWYKTNNVRLHAGVRVDRIDLRNRKVCADNSLVEEYDALVIATGSSPFIPKLDGMRSPDGEGNKPGIFVFRTLDDCDAITSYAARARKAVVIGGGLLGLEAARGLLNLGLETHVVHLMPHLMDVQLDPQAADVLHGTLKAMGVQIHLEKNSTAVLGDTFVEGLSFADGSKLECEMVVISAGIRPNSELARAAGLKVERGIVVEDDLSCSGRADVFAVGECAQHRGVVYGLVAPLWEQTAVLADRLTRASSSALYRGSRVSTKLKVMGVELAVMGEKEQAQPGDEAVTFSDPARGVYKKLILRGGRLAGAINLGDGTATPALLQAFNRQSIISAEPAELLFPNARATRATPGSAVSVAQELADEQICNCNNVSKAEILAAVRAGCTELEPLCAATRAGTGCGSCRDVVEKLLLSSTMLADTAVKSSLAIPVGHSNGTNGQSPAHDMAASPTPIGINGANSKGPRPQVKTVPQNKIEELKSVKDGLDVLDDIPHYASAGWETIPESERDRLKWAGVFFRKQTPGHFMMRLRSPNGIINSSQLRVIAAISDRFGKGFVDLTTRQQIQLRWFKIDDVPNVWSQLQEVGLVSLQTGMDNVRGVIGCAAAGLTPNELFDASPVAQEFNRMLVGNREFTNLPRKFNVCITGCLENCTHSDTQDLGLTPAVTSINGKELKGFNVAVGGKIGSGGYVAASPLDVFVTPEDAAELCRQITFIFRDHGLRDARNKARLAFLIESWGIRRFRSELEQRVGRLLTRAGRDARTTRKTDHTGVLRQKQRGLSSVGLIVPVGRITNTQLKEVARLADTYGSREIRLTVNQNIIIPNVSDPALPKLISESLLKELRYDASEIMRGLVSCTGMDYCHMALIETKELAIETARHLEQRSATAKPIAIHWSGCVAGCGNHTSADVGLVGKRIRQPDGEVVGAVDVFVGGASGPNATAAKKLLNNVPCDVLPRVLEGLVPYLERTTGS